MAPFITSRFHYLSTSPFWHYFDMTWRTVIRLLVSSGCWTYQIFSENRGTKKHQVALIQQKNETTRTVHHLRLIFIFHLFQCPKPIPLETQPIPNSPQTQSSTSSKSSSTIKKLSCQTTTSRWISIPTNDPPVVFRFVSFQPQWGWRPVCWNRWGKRLCCLSFWCCFSSRTFASRTSNSFEVRNWSTNDSGPGVWRTSDPSWVVFLGGGPHKRGWELGVEGWWYCLFIHSLWIQDTHQSTRYQV